jgi:hypothetical protein
MFEKIVNALSFKNAKKKKASKAKPAPLKSSASSSSGSELPRNDLALYVKMRKRREVFMPTAEEVELYNKIMEKRQAAYLAYKARTSPRGATVAEIKALFANHYAKQKEKNKVAKSKSKSKSKSGSEGTKSKSGSKSKSKSKA